MGALEDRLLRTIEEQRISVAVYPIGMEFDFRPGFLQKALVPLFSVVLVGDEEHYFDVSHRYYAQCFDLVLSTNPLVERYRLYGVEAQFLPGAFNSAVYRPAADKRKEIDVSFVGAMQGKVGRREYAGALQKAGIGFQAFGAGTPSGVLSRDEVVEIYRRSRINLNFTGGSLRTPLDTDLSINRRVRQVKGRCQMIALCGSFVLSEYAPGIEKLFEIGTEIDVFHDERELIDKIQFYLAHAEVREEMAARSYARAIKQYDLATFGRELAHALDRKAREKLGPARSAPIYLDRQFWSGFGAWRVKYLVIFVFSGKPSLFMRELALLIRTGHCKLYAAMWFGAIGLLVASRTSPLAAWLTRLARRARQSLLRPSDSNYG